MRNLALFGVSGATYFGQIYLVTPLIHFLLLTHTRLSNTTIAVIGVILMSGYPFAVLCDDPFLQQVGAFASMILFVLRALEIATFPRNVTSGWSLINYTEFLASSDNADLRFRRQIAENKLELERQEKKLPPLPKKKNGPFIATPSQRGLLFYAQFWTRMGATLLFYAFAKAYFELYPYEVRYGFISPLDTKGLTDVALVGGMVYCILELSNDFLLFFFRRDYGFVWC
ncbi:hypothetical protein HK100_007132 [Physocladia obscura]|uniref:Uncharacterized protein n=1 Tax=Physocladia obscura TaxID=109957 RepID=A0AAD5XAZ6_9FUNG|nr:hypothetical protein HK100_007132 [Physocladia obscura]